jgi:predicted AAA+ superfamily ATPase
MERLLSSYLFDPELTLGKMIFLTGPRQVGKTTFALNWLKESGVEGTYFNWDDPAVLQAYKRNPLFFKNVIDERHRGTPIPIVFDEIHKHKEWRQILKGLYDVNKERMQILVTGSARLGLYRKSGDSLLGRYFPFQMFPVGLPEAVGDFSYVLQEESPFSQGDALLELLRRISRAGLREPLEKLLAFGGFPEPFLKDSQRFHRRWLREYITLLTREDIRELSRISDLKGVERLVALLPARVGAPLSVNSLREDLGGHYQTIVNWIEVLKALFLVFTVSPWSRDIKRSLRKEAKLYFYDWSILDDPGCRFENLLALTLTRMAARFTETGRGNFEIRYVRDREKREVDFLLVKDDNPLCLIEAKLGEDKISAHGRYYAARLGVPFYQIVLNADAVEAFPGNCFLLPATDFFMVAG